MRMLPNVLPVATCRRCPQGGIEPRRRGDITMKFHATGDSSPPNTLLKQEGLQLAEDSFREIPIDREKMQIIS